MAAKTQWWKHGDHEAVKKAQPKRGKLDLCPVCSQANEGHGRLNGDLVHPGDYILTKNGGQHEVIHPDPLADALAAIGEPGE